MPKVEPIVVEKIWGSEVWLDNNPLYCGKLLNLRSGFRCSLHYHPKKTETFTVVEGIVGLEVHSEPHEARSEPLYLVLEVGDSYRIEAGTPHRFTALGGAVATVIEISTQHSDEDVVRLEESGPC